MAVTTYGINHPLAVKTWAKSLFVKTNKALDISKLMGKGDNNIIQVMDNMQKSAGDSVTVGLRMQLRGTGVSEHQVLEGNEEALNTLSDTLFINELNHAVRVKEKGTIDQQRIMFDMRSEARNGLVDWYSTRLSLMFFLQVCGYTATEAIVGGMKQYLSPVFWGFNTPQAPSSLRHFIAGGKPAEESITPADTFDLKMVDKAVQRAKLANPKIRPVIVGGDRVYVLYLHPTQVTQLRTNTDQGQWLDITKAVYNGSRAKNPIFDGSLGMYNGVVLRESEFVTTGVNSKTGKPIPNVRRGVLLGAQSAVFAVGKNQGNTTYSIVEQPFDYNRELGVAAKSILGIKKTRFQLPNLGDDAQITPQDFGTIVISTFAEEV
ncbi:N4-gp56 family major capsid protein [Bartonella sp. DGB2]|uniref:N4-gp56 family major capsid protein n=1 Tax=Bartonella sp. DGB2 TaxID=3388426 RepID=UPI00398FF1E2